MKEVIKDSINNPEQLETLYRSDKRKFIEAFIEIYPEISEHGVSNFWKVRLEFDTANNSSNKSGKKDILLLIIACVIAGLLKKLPQLLGFNPTANALVSLWFDIHWL